MLVLHTHLEFEVSFCATMHPQDLLAWAKNEGSSETLDSIRTHNPQPVLFELNAIFIGRASYL